LLADAVIVNYNLGIKDIFQEHGSGKDILFSKDYGGNSIINAGESFLWYRIASLHADVHHLLCDVFSTCCLTILGQT